MCVCARARVCVCVCVQAPKDTTPGWPNDKLYVYTEHSNIFADLFSDSRVLQTFNPTGSNPKAFKLFR